MFQFVNVVYHIDWFADIKESLQGMLFLRSLSIHIFSIKGNSNRFQGSQHTRIFLGAHHSAHYRWLATGGISIFSDSPWASTGLAEESAHLMPAERMDEMQTQNGRESSEASVAGRLCKFCSHPCAWQSSLHSWSQALQTTWLESFGAQAEQLYYIPQIINIWGAILFPRRRWHPTPVFLPGESHGQRSLVGCCP